MWDDMPPDDYISVVKAQRLTQRGLLTALAALVAQIGGAMYVNATATNLSSDSNGISTWQHLASGQQGTLGVALLAGMTIALGIFLLGLTWSMVGLTRWLRIRKHVRKYPKHIPPPQKSNHD